MKTFDFSLTNESSGEIEHKINESSFGDGYAQVSAVGINNKSEKWSIVAVGTAEQVRPIINFIDSHKGVKSFYWTPPQGEVGRYLTSAYKLTNIGGSAYRVTANFTQNFGVDSNTQALTNILTINQIGGDEDGNIELSATNLGAEEQGTAQRMMDLLKSEDNPFSQYAKNSDVVKSVNGEMPDADGNVIIDLNGGGSAITDEEIAKIKELAESSAASSESAKSAATDSAQFAKDGQSDALIAANAATSANTAAIDAVNSVERAEKATETANTNLNTAIETFQSLKPVLSVNKVEPDSTYRWNNNGTSNAILSGVFTGENVSNATLATGTATGTALYNLYMDASNTVPTAEENRPINVTGCWIIKLYGSISNTSELDASKLATEIAAISTRLAIIEAKQNEEYFTIIYPNGGTEEMPANITTSTRYVVTNPFKGHNINCRVELLINNTWGAPEYYHFMNGNTAASRGAVAHPLISTNGIDDQIIIQTGTVGVTGYSQNSGSPQGLNISIATAPCRLLVWRID